MLPSMRTMRSRLQSRFERPHATCTLPVHLQTFSTILKSKGALEAIGIWLLTPRMSSAATRSRTCTQIFESVRTPRRQPTEHTHTHTEEEEESKLINLKR
jgi:hypothetical protein